MASIAMRHLLQGRAKAVQTGWRLLPRAPRRLLVAVLRPVLPTVSALGEHIVGHHAAARARLQRLADDPRSRRFAVEAATACGEVATARTALADGRALPVTTVARVLRAEGHLTSARQVLRGSGPGKYLLRSAIDGELAALQPQGRPLPRRATWTPPRPSRPSDGLRVLHVVSNALPDVAAGYTLRTAGIVTAQARLGLEPHVVTRPGFPADLGVLAPRDVVDMDGVGHHRLLPTMLPQRRDRVIECGTTMLDALAQRLVPDVIHAHSRHDNAQVALRVGRRLGIPVVYEVRGMLEETWRSRGGDADSDHYRLTRAAETWCMRQADRVLTLSSAMAADIAARGVPREQVVVTGNAVDVDFLTPLDRVAARRRLGLDGTALVLGSVSTLNEYEGLDVLVRAAASADVTDLVLLVVGDGPARPELELLAQRSGARVVFTGWVPHEQVPAHLAAMDLFCVPRRPSTMTELVPPLKPVEAMAAGLPLLVSRLPALVELLDAEAFGWSAPAGDVDGWAARVRQIARCRDELVRRGGAGRGWVARERTWDQVALRQRDVYTALETVAARAVGASR